MTYGLLVIAIVLVYFLLSLFILFSRTIRSIFNDTIIQITNILFAFIVLAIGLDIFISALKQIWTA